MIRVGMVPAPEDASALAIRVENVPDERKLNLRVSVDAERQIAMIIRPGESFTLSGWVEACAIEEVAP